MDEYSPIEGRIAPDNFPEALPNIPPTEEEIYQLMEVWSNVTTIKSLRADDWSGTLRSEYMLWTTEDQRQFRIIWDNDKRLFVVSERTKPL